VKAEESEPLTVHLAKAEMNGRVRFDFSEPILMSDALRNHTFNSSDFNIRFKTQYDSYKYEETTPSSSGESDRSGKGRRLDDVEEETVSLEGWEVDLVTRNSIYF
jgi:hypothetical protein